MLPVRPKAGETGAQPRGLAHDTRQGPSGRIYQRHCPRVGRASEDGQPRAQARRCPKRTRQRDKFAKLAPYTAEVDALLAAGVWNAVVIYREIQARGYAGKLTVLRDYIRPKRALRPSRATVRFETAPGKQLQHDWGEVVTEIAGVSQKVYFAVNTLGYSRRFHFWAAVCMDAEHTYESLVRSFGWFEGVTDEVLVDNQKAAVIEHRVGQGVRFNPGFIDLAGHYGFTPRACRPYRARTKGKDERMVGYVKAHFFVRYRAFDSLAHLNGQAEAWLREEADRRVHGTVKEIVAERFEREAPALRALPSTPFDTSYRDVRQVAWDGYISVHGNRYSVPARYCGTTVAIRRGLDETLRVFDSADALIAEHRLRPPDQGWACVPAHHTALWQQALAVEARPLSAYEEVA